MIFVTVGTHEQQFNRLVEYMDRWAAEHDEQVIIQTGYTLFEPEHCKFQRFYRQDEMIEFIRSARIVITHGGPCCYTKVLHAQKVPIVVPRVHRLGEHIDDHQVEITEEYERRYHNIILIHDINTLGGTIEGYDDIVSKMNDPVGLSHNDEFCDALSEIVDKMFR